MVYKLNKVCIIGFFFHTITINNLNPRNFNVEIEADENGDFEFEFNESRDTIQSESILYSIVDEEGHLATLEKPIQ